MKTSIRLRITFIFIAITAVLIFAIFLANSFAFSTYYMGEKVKVLENAYVVLDDVFTQAKTDGVNFEQILGADNEEADNRVQSVFRKFFAGSNIDIVVLEKETGSSISASRERGWLVQKLEAYLEFSDFFESGQMPDSKYQKIKETERYTIQIVFDPRSQTTNLECWGTFTDDRISFLFSMPVMMVQETTKIINRFILIVGAVVLLIGSVIIYLITAKLTKPVNDLARISKKMSELDFSEHYQGNSRDEIGVLGQSMNAMSQKLETTINDLQVANSRLLETNEQLKIANEQLQKDIDLKEKIDVMRKDFIANVSHELKTPISLIEGYAEGLTEGIAEDPESRDYYCNVIIDEAGKMNHLVKQLTSLTQYEFGEADLQREEFDLTELVRNVLEKEKLHLEELNAKVILDLPETCPVSADEFKMEEVFTNFLTNAMNHLGGERRIIITVKQQENGQVRLSVYNDGECIPQDSIDRLWEKFYKVDKARTREYGGSGIGLSIVKAIIDAHGGNCGAVNHENGVEFYATLDGRT